MSRPIPYGTESTLQVYLKEINEVPLLSAEEEKELAQRALEGNAGARERLINANLRLVVSIARNYVYLGMPFPDIVGEGNLGLLHAVKGFDPSEGCRFSTYAAYWINQSILRAITNTGKTIRIPAHLIEKLSKWKSKSQELSERLNRPPSPAEIAEESGLTVEKMELIERAIKPTESLDNGVTGNGIVWTLGERMSDRRTQMPEEEVFRSYERGRVSELLDRLDERKATVLRLHFGIDDGRPLTLKQVGERLNISRERVRQIEREALRALGDMMPGEDDD